MRSAFNSSSASELNISNYNIACFAHVGQQWNVRTWTDGVSQQGAERNVSAEARQCIRLFVLLTVVGAYVH